MAVVLNPDNVHPVKVVTGDGNGNLLGLGVKGVPEQLGDTCQRLSRSRESIELVGVDLHDESLAHQGNL